MADEHLDERRLRRSIDAILEHLRAGRLLAAAEGGADPVAKAARGASHVRLLGLRGVSLALLGRAEDADRVLGEAFALRGSAGPGSVLHAYAAEAALWAGLPGQAIVHADSALSAPDLIDPEARMRALLARAWAAAELGRAPASRAIAGNAPARDASEWEIHGLHAIVAGRHDAAAGSFVRAAQRWTNVDAPRELLCRWAAAEARRRGEAASGLEAVASLRATLDAAVAMGFEPLVVRVRRSLRLTGHRSPAAAVPRARRGALSGRERQVLELVERGRTNPEIARRMGLGRPTVARLLSNAMSKLGADSRAHAVVLAAAAGSDRAPTATGSDRAHTANASARALTASGSPLRQANLDPDAREILTGLAGGRTLGEAAATLGLSRRTADRRLAMARAALGADRTVEAVVTAQRLGLLAS